MNKSMDSLEIINQEDIRFSHNEEMSLGGLVSERMLFSFFVGPVNKEVTIQTGELDGLSFLSDDNLFTKLVFHGVISPLISHFSQCEKNATSYTNPRYIKNSSFPCVEKTLFLHDTFVSKSKSSHQYRMSGGMSTYHTILEIDPSFLGMMCHAVEEGFCEIRRMDLCLDVTMDLMYYISNDAQSGRLSGHGSHLHGEGELNGKLFRDKVGRWSVNSSRLKKSELCLETLYAGHPRHGSCVVTFYDKKKEQLVRKRSLCPELTRIEVRLYNSVKNGKHKNVMKCLLYTLSSSVSKREGSYIRHFVLVVCAFSHTTFGNARSAAGEVESYSNWWKSLLIGCTAPYYGNNYNNLFRKDISPFEVYKLIGEFKSCPDAILKFLPCFSHSRPEEDTEVSGKNAVLMNPLKSYPVVSESTTSVSAEGREKSYGNFPSFLSSIVYPKPLSFSQPSSQPEESVLSSRQGLKKVKRLVKKYSKKRRSRNQ